MENLHRFKFIVVLILVILIFGGNLAAQTPQYYNYQNVGISNNAAPFNIPVGRAVQWLFYAGDFNQPAPLPTGRKITKIYFWIYLGAATAPTYNNFFIKMATDTITSIAQNTFYTGPMDTVYYRASVSIPGSTNTWMGITLDRPYVYNPAKSLIVMIGQCGHTGTGHIIKQNALQPNRRAFSTDGCPFVPNMVVETVANFGVDVETVTGVENNSTPVKFKLYDNYPNPFNPATTIKYDLAERTYVMLQIFDNAGRLVETLQNGYQTAGVHEKTFEGNNLSSGIYYYKLSAGNNVETRKMVLVK
ncbi:MAG: T9SS type A sorting domain-containing protein [Ignavibacteriae bacterium]|nr:T9SS type A sorting domain-containing protein [Ignavibacteriota bacterium]